MPKEWILNSATNRFQLNFKRNVGAVSEEIRKCAPKKIKDWENYYFDKVKSKKHISDLGKKLHTKMVDVVLPEAESITEKDCIDYIQDLVIKRTFDGYMREREIIYQQLEQELNVNIEQAPDEWDRRFNVDFFIELNGKYIGLQVKPVSNSSHIPQIFKEKRLQKETHEKFTKKYGGKVFYVISITDGKQKRIANAEITNEIRDEIDRLMKNL